MHNHLFKTILLLGLCGAWLAHGGEDDRARLVAAMVGPNRMAANLASLTDDIGGRPTGSQANLRAVDWALARFAEAGVTARKEAFTMPKLWLEKSAEGRIEGDTSFDLAVVAMPYSTATAADGLRVPLVDVGHGRAEDFAAVGDAVKGAAVLVHTDTLHTLEDLFAEYAQAPAVEARAVKAGAAAVVVMSSRDQMLLYRHNAGQGPANTLPMVIVARESALRAVRLLARGKKLSVVLRIALQPGDTYTSYNVIGEIPGTTHPEEIVVVGAHLDSWDLGTGALDNGCNVAMMLEIAAQMKRLGIQGARTIRFCLWNGEEQGLFGSYGYTRTHADELDRHVMALSMDIGSGRLMGFYVDGPPAFQAALDRVLEPVSGLGPFQHVVAPVVGTDNYDFMVQGVANLVGHQASANYAPNYHAAGDTFDKVDLAQLRLNSAVVAALTHGFADEPLTWKRRTRAELETLIRTTDLETQMRGWNLWQAWLDGSRGRARD